MAKLYTLLVAPLVLATITTNAQTAAPAEAIARYEANRKQILSSQTGNKTTGTDVSRMIGATHSEYTAGNFVVTDTTRLKYSGHRANNFNLDPWLLSHNGDFSLWLFDEQEYYTTAGKMWQRDKQEFDGNNNITKRHTERFNIPQAAWVPYQQKVYTYTANKLATEVSQTWISNQGQMQNKTFDNYTYNSNNQLALVDNQKWNITNSAWEDYYRYVYSYNGALMSASEIAFWDVFAAAMVPSVRNTYTYNGNLIVKDVTERYFNKQWNNYTEKTYSYTGTDATTIEIKNWNDQKALFEPAEKHIYTYDANHNKLTDLMEWYDAGNYYKRRLTTYTYNSFNQPLTEASQQWDGSKWVNDYFSGDLNVNNRFYYEAFNTYIKDAANDTPSITVFPSPASNLITVHTAFDQPKPFNIVIYNTDGQPVKQWQEAAVPNYNKTVQIDDLPTGQYYLKIIGDDLCKTARFTCTK